MERKMPFFLVGRIYPYWRLLIKPINHTTNLNERKFRGNQEASRKDLEPLFPIIKGSFQILRREIRAWELDDIQNSAEPWVILHNLIVHIQLNRFFVTRLVEKIS